jgi:pimeloyl-ACP methyl ester carboxylesterase
MFLTKGQRRLGIGVGALFICLLLWSPASRAILAVRLALSLQDLASGSSGPGLSVVQSKTSRRFQGQDVESLIYYPVKSAATKAVILVAGLSELGCRHPKLIALSRVLADKGLLVVTPDIREFRQFQISAEPINQVLFWYKQIPSIEGGGKVRTTGLVGISFSGTLVLMTAAKPEIRDSVGFVAAVGPYFDLMRCTREWFASGPEYTAREDYPTRFYAKWIMMLAALEMIPNPDDRLYLRKVLNSLLLQQKVPPVNRVLSEEGRRWYELATMREDQLTPKLAREIMKYLTARIYHELNPEEEIGGIRCPVFLVHGAYDDLIPPRESLDLHSRIPTSYLLLSPFLTHTHPMEIPLAPAKKYRAVLDTFFFCYELAKVIR